MRFNIASSANTSAIKCVTNPSNEISAKFTKFSTNEVGKMEALAVH